VLFPLLKPKWRLGVRQVTRVIAGWVTRVEIMPRTGHCWIALQGAFWCQSSTVPRGTEGASVPPRAWRSPQGQEGGKVNNLLHRLWSEDEGQDIAEYAVMLAVILLIVVGTVRLIGGNANNVFSSVSSSIGS
jgi:Flp pilus assembly pilin Flp